MSTWPAEIFPMRLLGMGLFLAWEVLIAPFEQANGIAGLSSTIGRFYIFSLVTSVLLCACAWRARRAGDARWGAKAVAVCGACAVLTPLLDLAGLAVPAGGFALDVCSLVCRSVADAGLFLMWNGVLAGHKARVAWAAYAGSFAVTACVYFAATALGMPVVTAAVFVLPVASCVLLNLSRTLPHDESAPESGVSWKFPWRPVALMAVFSFAYHLAEHLDGDLGVASELGRLAVAAVVLACLLVAFDRFDASLLYKASPALMVAGLLLAGVQEPAVLAHVRGFLVSLGYNGFTLYTFLILNAVCYRFKAPVAWLFGVTQAVCLLVSIPSSTLGDWLNAGGAARGPEVAVATGAVVVALVLLGMFLLTERTPVTTWGIKAVRVDRGADDAAPARRLETSSYLEDRVYRCAMVARHYGLTHREEEVLSLIAQGDSFQQIEQNLSIAHGTLRVHVQHIYAKLDVHAYDEVRELVARWHP